MTNATTKLSPLKWTRSEKTIGKSAMPTGKSIYTSADGRCVIRQQKFGSRTWYVLDVDGAPAPRRYREHDSLADAKWAANVLTNETWAEAQG